MVHVVEVNSPATSTVILVVEDDVLIRMGLVDYLTGRGFSTLEASDAAEAVATLAKPTHVDVVVTDVVMPGRMSGYELARWIRQHRPELPVIVATGVEGELRSAGGFRDRPDIVKPYLYRDVENRVRIALGGRSTIQR